VRKATEKALNRDIANLLLPCDVDLVQADSVLGFEGIDYVPEDSIAEEGKPLFSNVREMLRNRNVNASFVLQAVVRLRKSQIIALFLTGS
jgi:hypothetical protein